MTRLAVCSSADGEAGAMRGWGGGHWKTTRKTGKQTGRGGRAVHLTQT